MMIVTMGNTKNVASNFTSIFIVVGLSWRHYHARRLFAYSLRHTSSATPFCLIKIPDSFTGVGGDASYTSGAGDQRFLTARHLGSENESGSACGKSPQNRGDDFWIEGRELLSQFRDVPLGSGQCRLLFQPGDRAAFRATAFVIWRFARRIRLPSNPTRGAFFAG